MKRNIGIIGSGKLSKACVQGLIGAGVTAESITVCGRNPANLIAFSQMGCEVTTSYRKIVGVDYLLLMVTPAGAGEVIKKIGKALKVDKDINTRNVPTLVSFVSGLQSKTLSEYLKFPPYLIFTATCNTNIAYNCGLVALSFPTLDPVCGPSSAVQRVQKLLGLLGTVVLGSEDDIQRSITGWGSIVAFDALFIVYAYERIQDSLPLIDWLLMLKLSLSFPEGNEPGFVEGLDIVRQYISVKTKVLHGVLGCKDEVVSSRKNTVAFQSTLSALINMKVQEISDIQRHIATVPTKGGSTEKGLGDATDISFLLYENKFTQIITKIVAVSNTFPKIVSNSVASVFVEV